VTDLSTTYLGLGLRSPIVASASPLTGDPETAERIAAAGAGAIVLPSLFEEELLHEEVELERALDAGTEFHPEAVDYFPDVRDVVTTADRYVAVLAETKRRTSVPVIASLNASSPGSWERYARRLADAGADAIELNVYRVAADPTRTAADVEDDDLRMIAAVRASVDVPLAVKLSPYYTAMANFATRAVDAGADGLVVFNRFYQPDLDLERLEVVPRIELSNPWELRLPLRWIAVLRPLLPDASLAATSGVDAGSDVVKAVLAGADVVMTTSSLLRRGVDHLAAIERQLAAWLTDNGYNSVVQARGSVSYANNDDPAAYERANYLKVLHSWTTPQDQLR
jgi:dihydroorotate dehydrogenase (fumarate)